MLKRHETILKRHRSCVELLPHDVVELILERLPVDSLLRFKSVSKKWKLTIASRRFQEKQLIRRRQSRGPDVLCVCLSYHGDDGLDTDARRIVLGSSIAWTVRLPVSRSMFCHGSCDGLVCLYSVFFDSSVSVVVNPATRWHRSFPLSSYQQLLIEKYNRIEFSYPIPKLGFDKDKFSGTYKPVWLYNSYGRGLDNVTTCEVFDFSTNAWRYVVPASPYRIIGSPIVKKPRYYLSIFTLKRFKSSVKLPLLVYVTPLNCSPCASSITACAFLRKTGPPK